MTLNPSTAQSEAAGRQFRRGVFSVGGGSLISVAALLVEAVIVARSLPVADMGIYALFQATLSLLIIAVDLGFRTTAAQFLASETAPARQITIASTLLWLRCLVLAGLALLWLPAAPALTGWLGRPGAAPLLAGLPAVLALASLDELLSGILQGYQRYRPIALAQSMRSLLRLGLSTLLLIGLGLGLSSLLVSWLLSFGASAVLQYLAVPARPRPRLDGSVARAALRFGMPLQFTRYLWFGMQRVDTFVLSALTGPVGVAIYEVASRLPQGLQRLAEAYFAVYHPSLSSILARRERAATHRLMGRSLRVLGVATLGLAWGAVLFGHDLIVALFTARYAAAAPVLTLILVAFSLATSLNLLGYGLTASGQPGKSFAMNLLRTAVSLGGDFALIPTLGVAGAAYATLAAQAAAAPLAWWYARQAGLPAHGRALARHFVLAAGILAAHWWLPALSVGARAALLAAFPLGAAALALISLDDLGLILPERLLRRLIPASGAEGQLARPTGSGEL